MAEERQEVVSFTGARSGRTLKRKVKVMTPAAVEPAAAGAVATPAEPIVVTPSEPKIYIADPRADIMSNSMENLYDLAHHARPLVQLVLMYV